MSSAEKSRRYRARKRGELPPPTDHEPVLVDHDTKVDQIDRHVSTAIYTLGPPTNWRDWVMLMEWLAENRPRQITIAQARQGFFGDHYIPPPDPRRYDDDDGRTNETGDDGADRPAAE